LKSDLYQWKNNFLPKEDKINPYVGAQYDFEKKAIFIFDELPLIN